MTTENQDISQEQLEAKPQNWRSQVLDNLQTIAISLLLVLIIRVFIAEPRYIPSDSMFPTLETGDRVVIEKVSYNFHPPQLGDIIVFNPPSQLQDQGYPGDQAFIKRVIGTPNDVIEVRDNQVYLNNTPLQESYIAAPPDYELPPLEIPPGYLFVMGDNRNNSNDSHIWGYLPQENVIGHAIFRFWPSDRLGMITTPQPLGTISPQSPSINKGLLYH
ncbi:MAG: signal peptidase I [Kamptonema sp. SIO4C4]|nr:signal peptidase I [Kamptonema sp. SIO4C4]